VSLAYVGYYFAMSAFLTARGVPDHEEESA